MIRRSTPDKPKLLVNSTSKSLPTRVEAVLAMIEMGVTDYATIASTVGLAEEDVIEIDHSDDQRIRRIAVRGLDPEKRFHLVRPIRCPKCRNRITVAPCLTCRELPAS
jgi:hypothetical protein